MEGTKTKIAVDRTSIPIKGHTFTMVRSIGCLMIYRFIPTDGVVWPTTRVTR